jgi:hypothetical protein
MIAELFVRLGLRDATGPCDPTCEFDVNISKGVITHPNLVKFRGRVAPRTKRPEHWWRSRTNSLPDPAVFHSRMVEEAGVATPGRRDAPACGRRGKIGLGESRAAPSKRVLRCSPCSVEAKRIASRCPLCGQKLTPLERPPSAKRAFDCTRQNIMLDPLIVGSVRLATSTAWWAAASAAWSPASLADLTALRAIINSLTRTDRDAAGRPGFAGRQSLPQTTKYLPSGVTGCA